jgi:hypothetical protein
MLVLVLVACKPEQGVPADSGCIPVEVGNGCSIWECWETIPNGLVQYTFAAGWNGKEFDIRSGPCSSPTACAEKEQEVVKETCPGAA